MGEFGPAERDAVCPVSLDALGALYKADPYDLPELIADVSIEIRPRLALYCYGKAHLRSLAVAVAAECQEGELAAVGGIVGEALASQAKNGQKRAGSSPKREASAPKLRISLAGGKPR